MSSYNDSITTEKRKQERIFTHMSRNVTSLHALFALCCFLIYNIYGSSLQAYWHISSYQKLLMTAPHGDDKSNIWHGLVASSLLPLNIWFDLNEIVFSKWVCSIETSFLPTSALLPSLQNPCAWCLDVCIILYTLERSLEKQKLLGKIKMLSL